MRELLLFIFTINCLCAQSQNKVVTNLQELTADFSNDPNGLLGLRAQHFSGGSVYKIDNVSMADFFTHKTKSEILNILGTPNEVSTTMESEQNESFKTDKVSYIISHRDQTCKESSNGKQSSLYVVGGEEGNEESGVVSSVSIEYSHNCEIPTKHTETQVTKITIQFYL